MLAWISSLVPRWVGWIASFLPTWFHPGSTLLGLALGIGGSLYLQSRRQVEKEEQEERQNWHSDNWWCQQWAHRDLGTKWKQRFGDGNDDDDDEVDLFTKWKQRLGDDNDDENPYDAFADTCTRAHHLEGKHPW